MPIKFDFHCHSTASDGELSPEALLRRAQANAIELFAITDHDTVDGYLAVCDISQDSKTSCRLISGVELSCQWGKLGVHVVGLQMDVHDQAFVAALSGQQQARRQRAKIIGEKLAQRGIEGAYEGALALAGDAQPGRPHFAQYLVEKAYVSSIQEAFKKYLGAGKVGDVKNLWPSLAEGVSWITAAGGVAILAHPSKYRLTGTKLRALLSAFVEAGGQGLEVVGAAQTGDVTQYLAALSQEFDLLASGGSDLHQADLKWCELGKLPPLPAMCRPIWEAWQ